MTLLRRLIPALPWIQWLPVAVLVGLLAWLTVGTPPDFPTRQFYLRAGLLVATLGLSFAFDDPAAPTTDSTPSPLRVRRAARIGLSLVPWIILVTALLWAGSEDGLEPEFVASADGAGSELPIGRLLLEAATMASWVIAIAGTIAKRWDDEPGKIAAPALLAIYAGSWLIAERWRPWAIPSASGWETGRPWWWIAFGLGAAISVTSGWDSRRQGLLRQMTGSRGVARFGMTDPECQVDGERQLCRSEVGGHCQGVEVASITEEGPNDPPAGVGQLHES